MCSGLEVAPTFGVFAAFHPVALLRPSLLRGPLSILTSKRQERVALTSFMAYSYVNSFV